jgi:hypothetical protein
MDKVEILDIVKLMLLDWQSSYDSKDSTAVYNNYCQMGFCFWIIVNGFSYDEVLDELIEDVKTFFIDTFWYNTFKYSDNHNNFETLVPRINHLKRTIARIEKEIAN